MSSPDKLSPPPPPPGASSSSSIVDPLPGSTDTKSFDNVSEIDWSREQDNRMRTLKTQFDKDGHLPAELEAEFRILAKQYELFEQEGIKRLMNGATPESSHASAHSQGSPAAIARASAKTTPSTTSGGDGGFFSTASSWLGRGVDYVSEGASKLKPQVKEAGRAAWFYSSLGVTAAAPGFIGRKLGLTDRYDHWNWIIPYTKNNRQGGLLLGGIPVMTEAFGSGGHLKVIHEEAKQYGSEMGMVVSIVLPSEMNGFGASMIKFANHQDWKDEFGKDFRCRLLPIEDNTANGFSFDLVMTTLDEMNEVMLTGKNVYVHCAKGVGRSLTMVVCYLMVFLNKNPDEALAHAKACRHQVSPNKVQMDFIRSFYTMFKRIESLEEEERKKKYETLPNVGLSDLLKKQEEDDTKKAMENSLASADQKENITNNNNDDDDDNQQTKQEQQQPEPEAQTVKKETADVDEVASPAQEEENDNKSVSTAKEPKKKKNKQQKKNQLDSIFGEEQS